MTTNDNIIIQDWTGRELFRGHCNDSQIDKVLDANRCDCTDDDRPTCDECNGTGYSGDFEIYWECPEDHDDDNVYEYINY